MKYANYSQLPIEPFRALILNVVDIDSVSNVRRFHLTRRRRRRRRIDVDDGRAEVSDDLRKVLHHGGRERAEAARVEEAEARSRTHFLDYLVQVTAPVLKLKRNCFILSRKISYLDGDNISKINSNFQTIKVSIFFDSLMKHHLLDSN